MRESESPLEDFPLHGDAAEPAAASAVREAGGASARIAPFSARAAAAAADAAAVLLLSALAVLAARLVTGQSPRPAGIVWAGAFVVYLSLFATVAPLVLFGKTVGMALAELSARTEPGAGLPASAAARRWLGTLLTTATAGLALLWTRSDPRAPTPADRLSGHALTVD